MIIKYPRYSESGIKKMHQANERRFIADAKKKFDDKYDYSHVIYNGVVRVLRTGDRDL